MNAFDEQQMLAAVAERDALLDDANTRLAERLELIDKLRQELDEATSKLDAYRKCDKCGLSWTGRDGDCPECCRRLEAESAKQHLTQAFENGQAANDLASRLDDATQNHESQLGIMRAQRERILELEGRLQALSAELAKYDDLELPKVKPSCLVCGRDDYDEPAIKHLTLGAIVVCPRCHDAASRLDAIKKEVSGDWGINPTMAIERIQALLGMAPPACQHLYNFKSPNKCILCGDDPEPK